MRYHLQFSRKTLVIFGVGFLSLVLLFAVTYRQTSTSALSARDFNYGRIIDDGVFYNKDSMNIHQIQDFLNRLIPNCDTWGVGQSEYGGGTRAQYAASRGWPGPPYVCLNNYHENPHTGETSFERGGGAFSGGMPAAQIIYNAAQQYNINPRVLLVLLKKESAGPLTADTWPLKSQYKYAMGYACPDSGPGHSANCSVEKSGFYKQMMLAAWQLNYYRNHPNDYRYKIGWNDIQYSPNPACGTRKVYIENIATLSLYIYTPYVPNEGALANYPGTAHCGAYGNRNFFMFYSEWYGTTYGGIQIDMTKANQDITATYNAHSSQLGTPLTQRIPEYSTDGRVWQTYTGGTIIWTPYTGAHPVFNNDIHNRWRALGGSLGSLGVPVASPTTASDDTRMWQEFKHGVIIHSSQTGAWEVFHGPIGDKWRSAGGSTGSLGRPTSGVVITSDMRKQTFEQGIVARKNSHSPTYIVTSPIYSRWQHDQSFLKAPAMDAVTESSDGRVWQYFDGGLVIKAGGDARTIRMGGFHGKWKELGGSNGKLGTPVTNQVSEPNGRIWQEFEHGYLIQKNSLRGIYEVLFGTIYDRWREIGGSTGDLGTPQSSLFTENDGRKWQDFEKGTVIWSEDTGAWEMLGGFYTFWKQQGGSLGSLGKPTSPRIIESNGTRWQDFEKGKAIWKDATGWSIEWN